MSMLGMNGLHECAPEYTGRLPWLFCVSALHASDFLPSLTCSVQHVRPASCTSKEGSQRSPPEARGTGRNGNWTMVLYTPSPVVDGLQQETNQRNQKNTVSC